MGGKSSQRKGKAGELELMHILRDTYGYNVKRGSVFNGTSDVIGLKGIHIECKRQEMLNLRAAMTQAVQEAEKRNDGMPVVFHRKNNCEWMVSMQLPTFMDLYGAWNDEKEDSERTST